MSIRDLYPSDAHSRNLSHFANIVKLALADGELSDSEKEMLEKLAKTLQIGDKHYQNVLNDPNKYTIRSPNNYDERIERLYRLTKIVCINGKVVGAEMVVLRRIAIGLGFSTANAEKVCDEAVHLVINDNSLEEFSEAIKTVNKTE